MKTTKHLGFKKTAANIAAKEGISKQKASAILASAGREASASAKRKKSKIK
jgi:hypothetical protein